MRHVRLDQMSSTQCAVQRKLSCKHTGGDNAGELASVVAGCLLVGAAYTEEIEHGGLRL